MAFPNKIRFKQLDSGEFVDIITSIVDHELESVFETTRTGYLQAQTLNLPSGAQYYNISFNSNFDNTPVLAGSIYSPSGFSQLSWNTVQKTVSGAVIEFSNYIPSTGYVLDLIAIDTLLVASGLASVLDFSSFGTDLVSAPNYTYALLLLNAQDKSEKSQANGYCALDAAALIPTGNIPSYGVIDGGSF